METQKRTLGVSVVKKFRPQFFVFFRNHENAIIQLLLTKCVRKIMISTKNCQPSQYFLWVSVYALSKKKRTSKPTFCLSLNRFVLRGARGKVVLSYTFSSLHFHFFIFISSFHLLKDYGYPNDKANNDFGNPIKNKGKRPLKTAEIEINRTEKDEAC